MSFLAPWAFGFLGLVPVIVALYLLKVKRRAVAVSTLMFWQRVLVENRRRALFHRLRRLFSLLLHLLIFTLILLALARPELSGSRRTGSAAATVLILDTRARMQAVGSDGVSFFERARRELAAEARRADAGHEFALLTSDAAARVAAPFTGDEKSLQSAIARLQPADAAGELDGALRLADSLLAARSGEKSIVVFTDRPFEKNRPPAASVVCVVVGERRDNVAITRFSARPVLNSPQTSAVFLELRNFGAKPVRGNVELYFDETLLDVKPFDLAPGARRAETFSLLPPIGKNSRGWLRARLDISDSLALDNTAYAVLPRPAVKRVLLVTRGNWFLENLLAADPLAKWELLAPEAFRPAMAAGFDAVIFDDALPENFDMENAAGNFLFIRQSPWTKPESLEQPVVSEADERSPLLRLVALQNVSFFRAARLDAGTAGAWHFETPVRSPEGPLILTGEHARDEHHTQRVAVFAFGVAETDLPLRVAFPLLMANTLEWLAGEKTEPARSLRAGEICALGAGETVQAEPQTKLAADPQAAPALARGSFQPKRNGWYASEVEGRVSWIAVNTFSDEESDGRSAAPASRSGGGEPARASFHRLSTWPAWFGLALAAFVLFSIEWRLFHRRRTE